jgi:hypothetical protein
MGFFRLQDLLHGLQILLSGQLQFRWHTIPLLILPCLIIYVSNIQSFDRSPSLSLFFWSFPVSFLAVPLSFSPFSKPIYPPIYQHTNSKKGPLHLHLPPNPPPSLAIPRPYPQQADLLVPRPPCRKRKPPPRILSRTRDLRAHSPHCAQHAFHQHRHGLTIHLRLPEGQCTESTLVLDYRCAERSVQHA